MSYDKKPFCPYCNKVVNAKLLSDLSSINDPDAKNPKFVFFECENRHIIKFEHTDTYKKQDHL